ncbi:MAG: precorrin-6Y C5,15-methyltransferase (decarboxylating) subunit CbiT [Synergistaceae bacterium]|nr:precorrin-6Y C5,15-methyltransferase (decarboxylating) subunit CbiT [Synergistaceae bacterium]
MTTDLPERGVLADDWFERMDGIPMTKAPVRSLAISILLPLNGASVLETGSGTGAMTVELARAVGEEGRVTSLEFLRAASELAAKNVERSGLASRVEIIAGRAPKAIPDGEFDAAFVGGHGRDLEAVLSACWRRLSSRGRLLLTAITPGTTSRTLAFFDSIDAKVGFWRVQTSTGRKAGSDWLLLGNNPIDLIWGDR